MKRPLSLSFAAAACALACVPKLADDQARIAAPRVLAVRASPAEAKPGLPVTLTALIAAPAGASATGDGLEWAMCLARKPLTELGPVAQECVDRFGEGGEDFLRLGRGASVTGTVPADACRRFGPLAPPATAGGVAGRPVDPDLSGGYHQPIVLGSEAGAALASVRLACGVIGVPNAESVRYGQGYRPNENPEIDRVEIVSGEARVIEPGVEAPGASVAPGSRVELRASWAACPREPVCGDGLCTAGENQSSCADDCRDEPRGCTGAETYLWANPETRTVQERREGVRVAWFSTGGVFAEDQTGRSEQDADGTDTSNVWTAPSERGPVRLWTVIRDDRGGVGWRELAVAVE
ncbi:MAG: hypothetical protein KF782_17850 [Labilithrix sp.]|nr:hypothetical protein [Labilithrix sp.]